MRKEKRCSGCKVWKPLTEFNKHKGKKDGLYCYCRKCQAEYYQNNKEQILKQKREYRKTHRKKGVEYAFQYRMTHQKEIIEYGRKYRKIHKKQIAEYGHQYYKTHMDEGRRFRSLKRNLGYNPLNEWFKGADMHHINDTDVVFIPRTIHLKFTNGGYTLEQHRNDIFNYYGSIRNMINNNPIED